MKYAVTLFILTSWVLMPQLVAGQGLVTCSGEDCSACNLVSMANLVIDWLIGVLLVVFGVLMTVAGFKLVLSRGDQSALTEAKQMFTNAIVGFLIILAAWIIVDTLMRGLNVQGMSGGPLPWSTVTCQEQTDPHAPRRDATQVIDPVSGRILGQSQPPSPHADCPSCVQLQTMVSCNNPRSCTVDRNFAERFQGVLTASGERIQVTEGFPPTRQHQNACHANGTCLDIVFQDRQWNQERIDRFQSAAQANGCRAVFEPAAGGSCPSGSYVPGRGTGNTCLPHSVTRSSGNHFSLYCN